MKKIAIAGAGGFAKEVVLTLQAINQIEPTWEIVGLFDDKKEPGHFFMGLNILGTIDDMNDLEGNVAIVIGVGRSLNLQSISEKLSTEKFSFPNIIHPTAFIHKESFKIGIGNIIQNNVLFSADNQIGNFNMLNFDVRVGHDTIIGNYNTFGVFTMISGGVQIGNANDFGINSGILQYKKIGNNNVIAPLSILYKSIKNDGHYIGNPAMPTGL